MPSHTHEDDRLTFACPGCIDQVKLDQHLAAVDEQPERPFTVAYSTTTHDTVTIDVKYLDGEEPADVGDRNMAAIIAVIGDAAEVQEFAFGDKLP